jgi:transcriptional regulator with XRE-family HTH domain
MELAQRSGLQASVLSLYEHGRRQPAVAALARIATAAGFEIHVAPAPDWQALERAGKTLAQVLELAEQMPARPRGELQYPPLTRMVP